MEQFTVKLGLIEVDEEGGLNQYLDGVYEEVAFFGLSDTQDFKFGVEYIVTIEEA